MKFLNVAKRPFLIAGPCSAESRDQLYQIAKKVKDLGVDNIRAGVWKPRTRPATFEGAGKAALEWIQDIKAELNVKFATEVATPSHVEQALKAEIDIFWIGTRTTANPFAVQELANSLAGIDKPVLVKNPLHPDISLWLGALERFDKANISGLAAIHRGFTSFQKSAFRNPPTWHIAVELKSAIPEIPLICDPSHIAGDSTLIKDLCQKAMNLDYDGLMVEVHTDPDNALSDRDQQITPEEFGDILKHLKLPSRHSLDKHFLSNLEKLRERIDFVDRELIEALGARMKLVDKIGDYKKEKNVTVFQLERFREIIKTRPEWGTELELDEEFMRKIYKVIHDESIRLQTVIVNNKASNPES